MIYAIIRLAGLNNVRYDLDKTLRLLKLNRRYHCTLMPATKEVTGMLNKVQKLITWGEINQDELYHMLVKRGRVAQNKKVTEEYLKQAIKKDAKTLAKELIEEKLKLKDVPGLKTIFRLRPPAKGYHGKSVKTHYAMGGMCGYRGEEINTLLKRMI